MDIAVVHNSRYCMMLHILRAVMGILISTCAKKALAMMTLRTKSKRVADAVWKKGCNVSELQHRRQRCWIASSRKHLVRLWAGNKGIVCLSSDILEDYNLNETWTFSGACPTTLPAGSYRQT